MKTPMIFCLICLVCAGGCAGRTVGAGALSSASVPALREDSFAALVAGQSEGAAVPVALTPFGGEALISAGPMYRSGLDSTCRQAVAETAGGERRTFVVCRNADGVWTYVPPIFESTPR